MNDSDFHTFAGSKPVGRRPARIAGACLAIAAIVAAAAWSKSMKHVIGATAIITEVSSGFTFPARIDTGAESCSLHVEKVEIADESSKRLDNVDKRIRFQLKSGGKTKWMESRIAEAIRIRTASLKSGKFDHRYKVWLTLEWNDVRKEVLVTLNDRTDMEYPLLIGRNFLKGDFLVDVEKKESEQD